MQFPIIRNLGVNVRQREYFGKLYKSRCIQNYENIWLSGLDLCYSYYSLTSLSMLFNFITIACFLKSF